MTGLVISKDDGSHLPGVNVVEKGTRNGTVTNDGGYFSIKTSSSNPVLVFSFIGLVTQEVQIGDQNDIKVSMKTDCIRDYFDVQEINLYTYNGVINNPLGGKIDISFPAYFGKGTLRGGLSYQTNLKHNYFSSAQLEFNHFVWTCNYELNAAWYYRDIDFANKFRAFAHSYEITQRFDRSLINTLIIGYSNIGFRNTEKNYQLKSNGLIIGTELWTGRTIKAIITVKTAIHNDFIEWQARIKRRLGPLNTFIYYYRLDTFNELSLGIGYELNYRLRRRD